MKRGNIRIGKKYLKSENGKNIIMFVLQYKDPVKKIWIPIVEQNTKNERNICQYLDKGNAITKFNEILESRGQKTIADRYNNQKLRTKGNNKICKSQLLKNPRLKKSANL